MIFTIPLWYKTYKTVLGCSWVSSKSTELHDKLIE